MESHGIVFSKKLIKCYQKNLPFVNFSSEHENVIGVSIWQLPLIFMILLLVLVSVVLCIWQDNNSSRGQTVVQLEELDIQKLDHRLGA